MTLKTGILAAAAALTLAVPAAALAQPYYGSHGYDRHEDFRRFERHGDFGRIEREREFRRQEWRRLRFEREHSYGYRGYYGGYR